MNIHTGDAEGLRQLAVGCLNDNQHPGSDGYCDPAQAHWSREVLCAAQLTNIFESASKARAWLLEEIALDEEEDLGRGWSSLLNEDIREAVVLLVRDGRAHVWDGWHRCAAAIGRDIPLIAIVGRPRV